MPEHTFRLTCVLQALENDTYLAEALFFPEVSCYGDDPDDLLDTLHLSIERLIKDTAPGELFQRNGPSHAEGDTVTLSLENTTLPAPEPALSEEPKQKPDTLPQYALSAWREPVSLTLPIVRWSHGTDFHLAFVPGLRIQVIAPTWEALNARLPMHIRTALLRNKEYALHRLAWLQRCPEVRIEKRSVPVSLLTPKQAILKEEQERQQREAVLKDIGTNLTWITLAPAYEMDDLITRIVEILTGRTPRSVLLVGPSGVGKTACFHQLVRTRAAHGLGRTPFWGTSGSRLVAGMSGFGMWQERCQRLWREASREKAILHLGNLVELLEVGKSEYQSQGLATFFRPYLSRGELLAVVECTPEQIPVIERLDPHLLRVFTQVRVEEPSSEKLRRILQQFVADQHGPAVPSPTLDTLERLHARYATYSANPGRPLRFLRNLLADHKNSAALSPQDVSAAFARETGLPRFLLDEREPLDLPRAREWFRSRVIGQREAVDRVVNLLATIKAGLSRPHKPLASLIFIGPTGVGKTEMAKALAEFLFGSKQRLTRFDMSEYTDVLAVGRLIGGVGSCEGVLTARVREQPFSVILLDEVEKAHPQMFDLLLQVLGEGRLTDASGRLADFRNSVVIMTSNLGAQTYIQGGMGFGGQQASIPTATEQKAREHFVHEVQSFLRPELFNRIDRIVPFAPLDEATILHIANRQLQLLKERDGIRYRGVLLDVEPEVARELARRGYDSRYGARPLKRAIERELLAPLAEQMNGYTAESSLRVRVSLQDGELAIHVRARTDEAGRQRGSLGLGHAEAELARACVDLRRDMQKLQRCPAVIEVSNEIYRLEEQRRWKRITAFDARLAHLCKLRDEVEELYQKAATLEDDTLLALHQHTQEHAPDTVQVRAGVEEARTRWEEVLLALYFLEFETANQISLAVFSEDPDHLFVLARAYYTLARERSGRVEVWQFTPARPERGEDPVPERRLLLSSDDIFEDETIEVRPWDRRRKALQREQRVQSRKGVIGIGIFLEGAGVYPYLANEVGMHHFPDARPPARCMVDTSDLLMTGYTPPQGVDRRGSLRPLEKRRTYYPERGYAEDEQLTRRLTMSGPDALVAVLRKATEESLRARARGLLGA